MKYLSVSSLILGSFLLLIHLSSFQKGPEDLSTKVISAIQHYFHNRLKNFEQSVATYHTVFKQYAANKTTLDAVKNAHLATRLAFKQAEYLLEYNDPYAIKKSLNGPPLPSLEPKVPEIRILEPQGLQVLDELLFAKENPDIKALSTQLEALVVATKKIVTYQKTLQLEHREVLEAVRLELVRLFTLGLTGFDTPGSLNAIPEAISVMENLEFVMLQYHPLLESKTPDLLAALTNTFALARNMLEQTSDFASFDRLLFYRQYLQKLNELVWQVQNVLGIETTDEVTNLPQALQLKGAPLFGTDFFNTSYYRGFAADDRIDEKIELGRLLFYDPILSANNQRACASCHHPDAAFTDGRAKSLAMDQEHNIQRNAPTLLNSVFTERFFYDLRESQLERQIKHVVLDENEFSTDFLAIADKLAQSEEYQQRFNSAFPLAKISKYSISNALAAYLSELTSFDSEFDRYARGETDQIDEAVKRGFNLFMGKAACGTCHFAPTFSGLVPPYYVESESEVLGIPIHPDSSRIDPDLGRIGSNRPIDEAPFYQFSFKTTTVRNVEHTAPYMHNGAFKDLATVVDFYNKGGGAGLGIHLEHQTLAPDPLDLTTTEVNDLIAFMNSLTDLSKVGNAPTELPKFMQHPEWNIRTIGGNY